MIAQALGGTNKNTQHVVIVLGAVLTVLMIRHYMLSIKKTELEIGIIENKQSNE